MKNLFVPVIFFFLLATLSAKDIANDDLRKIDSHIDSILNLSQSYSGQVRADIMNSALEIRRLLSKESVGSDSRRLLSDQELLQSVAALKSFQTYQEQRAFLVSALSSKRLTVFQLKRIIVCVGDVRNRGDCLSLIFPLVIDPENIGRLLDVDSSEEQKTERPRVYSDAEVDSLVLRLKAAWPYDGQKILVQKLPANQKFTVAQVKTIVGVIDFDRDKKEILSMILPGVVDPDKIDLLFDIFWTKSDKEFLSSLVKQGK